ncbi:FG-GAP-like repeat-containing protein [Microcoleus vaginatus GB2-A3]|uniref:FG-GAP-like repeat-containing protein n=1 Tax=Microcoleus vaginatus TaxID=119532 RepID=UPI0032A3F878
MPNLNNQVSPSAIAFIDTKVENYQSLIAGVTPGTEVVVLDGNRDAIDQITQILALRTNIDSIHIVSHGAPGSLQLGDVRFSLDDIECDRDSLQQWFSPQTDSLSKNRPNILLYGCSVATGETGKAFVKRLSELTGASVAASQNLTGNVAKGGDWELEVRTGTIETPLVFEPEVLAGYEYVLNSFGAETNFNASDQPQFVGVGDFNGDTKPDLAVANRATANNLSILLGTGTGSFSDPTNLTVGDAPFAVTVADFNGDTNLDLAVANWKTNNVSILLGTGTGSFGTATNFNVGLSPWSVTSGDFNGDGNIDIATANIDSNNVSILLGTGTGSFGPATNFIVGTQPQSVSVGDFNGDGKLDLATANYISNNVSILLGTGTGSFGTATGFGVGTNPFSVAVQDFNGDGNPDIATANQGSNDVSVLLGNGTGGFGANTNFAVGTGPRSVTVGDFNADGTIDLATANGVATKTPVANNLSVLLGTGTGTFSPATNYSLGSNPWTVTAADLNADGNLDLATSNYWTDNVSILLNTPNTVNFGAATYSGTEGTTDTVVDIPVTLSGGIPFSDVVVPIVIDPSSTGTENSDYAFSPTSITFPAGATGAELTKTVAVTIKPDNIPENAETAILNLGTITGGVAGTTKQTTLTIAANDQPSSLTPYQIDLKTGAITGGQNQFISLVNTPTDSNADSWLEAVAKINFDGKIKKAKFIVEYDKAPSGWTVNLGDSGSNDGYGGDGSTQSRDAEMNIVNGNMSVFGNDYNTPPGGELTPGNVPNFVTNASSVEFEVSNEQLGWDNKSGLKNSLNSPYLYALNGQVDATGPVNSEIYAGFNRVISGPGDRIGSGASKVTILLNPIDYAVTAGVATVTEGNSGTTAATFTVTRSGCTDLASTVDYAIGGSASNVSDYNNIAGTSGATAATGTVNFAAGETSKTITLDVLGDSAIEANETLEVTLSNASVLDSTPTITTASASTTISNDDTAGVSITPTETTATEGGASGTYSAVLKSQPSAPVTITLTTGDQIQAIAPLTFTPDNWNVAQTVTVQAVNDTSVEGAHSANLTHIVSSADTNYNGIVVPGVTVAITDNDVPPKPEEPVSTSTLSPYQIDLKTGAITGQQNKFISLVNTPTDSNADSWLEAVAKINFDGKIKKAKFIVEYDKAPSGWTVNLGDSGSNNGYGGDGSTQSRDAEMNIVNGNMSVFGNDYNTPPGGELAPGNVPNFVSNASRVEFEISNEQLAWDNKNGLKNSLNSPYLYALNGQPDDTGPVNSEIYAGFNRVISGPGDRIGSGASKVTILLNPIDYAVTAGVATVTEGNSGTTAATFTVTRSGCTELASTVDYAIAGTASNASDYKNIGGTSGATAATGTINFAAGETSKTITLDVLGDAAIETNETLEVTLSNPSALDSTPTITTATATTTISNDDTAGFTINPTTLTTSEVGGQADFTVKLDAQPTADVAIGLSSDNVAEGTVSTNTITFTPANYNEPQKVTVTGVNDLLADGDKAYKIVTAVAVSTDPDFNNLNPDDVTVTNSDNETPGVTVNPTAGLTTGEAGSSANFTVVLNTQPTANVTIGLNTDNLAEGTVSPNTLTFTPTNWSAPQQVTVTGVDDSLADGDMGYKVVTGTTVSTDGDYSNRDVADVSLSNKDDDTAGISITPTATTATEGGANGTYRAVLKSKPTAPVTITLTTGNQIETIAPLTFTPDNWDQAQTVTVKAVDDTVLEGAQSANITHTVTSTDAKYNSGIVVPGVTVAIADNDTATPPPPPGTPDIIINPVSGLVTTEAGGTEKFTIKLNSQPTADVKIGLRSSDEAEGVISTESITFNSANWDVPQEITVTGVEDSVVDGDIDYKIVTEKAVSTDANYNERDVADVSVSNQDNDVPPPLGTPDIIINPVSGLVTTEAGGTEKFTIKLNSQPTADVKIGLRSSDEAEGVISTESITFNSANWNVAQEITVTGVEDSVVDGDIDYKIVTEKAVSTDPTYNERDVADVRVSNQDNDVAPPQVGSPGIVISPASGLVTTEAGGTDTFTIKLTRPPTADVKIDLRSNNEAEGVISTESITFNSVNWDLWQPITITGVDDRVFDIDKSYQIVTAPAVSADSGYNGLNAPDASVVNRGNTIPPSEEKPPSGDSSSDLDSDTAANPGITVSPTNGLITTKTGGKAKFTLALNSKPTAPVTIGLNVSPQNPTEGSLSTPGVTFTPDNWNIPQEVTVKGEGGTFSAAANRPYTIVTAPAISTDSKYSDLDASDVSLTNMFVYADPYNQYPQIVVGPTNELITTEAGDTANFSVVLTQQPMADVVIPVSSDNTAEGTVSVSTLKFTPDNWDIAQTVTIKGINDNQSDGDRPYKIILGEAISNESADSGSSFGSPRYSGFDPQDVSVTNLERSYTFNKINTEISNDFNGGAISGWGDYSGDGKLDFIASGRPKPLSSFGSSSDFTGTWLYRNSGSTFTAESGYPSWESASAASWGDYNNDSQLDFLLQTNGGKYGTPSSLKLFGNNGDGWNGSTIEYIGLNNSSSPAWGDYNNDGKPDILNATKQSITTENADGTFSTLENASLLYRNTGKSDIVLTADITTQLPGVLNGSAAWGDYNKDGKLDILLTGDSVSGKIAKVFRNTGSGFSEAFALPGVSNGSAAWGDYDNDGDLDILLAGNSDSGNITKVYRNTGSGFSEDTTAALPGGSSAALGDYDNDGKLDILLDSKVYRNTGSGFSEDTSAGVTGEGSGAWGDYDSDGKLDILLGNQVYRNDTAIANTPPTAPTGLSAEPSGREVTFNWNKANDAQTPADGLSYNLRVGTTIGGSDILVPMSLNDGTRQVVGLGNANQNTTWQLKDLSPGTYYWSVQAIDTAWAGSEFATEGSFTVGNRPPEEKISLGGRYSEFNQAIQDVYTDPDGDQISYQLTLLDGSPLYSYPYSSWLGLEFDSPTNEIRFIGTPPTGAQPFRAKLIATDSYGASSEQIFTVTTYPGTDRWVIDGYIDGATVFLDANKNGIKDTNEPSTTTDSGGKFNLNIPFETFDTNKNGEIDPSEGNLVAIGGTDTATGLPLETPVTAPPDSSVVTLLTSLIADLIDKGIEPEEAQSLVKAALGLPAEVDLTSLDPILATNNNQPGGVQVLAEMVKVQNFITQTSALIDGASSAANTDIVKAVVSSITAQIQSGTVLNLSNAAALEPIIQQAATKIQQIDPSFNSQQVSQITSQAATVMATANQRIDATVSNPTATSIPESLARLQQVALGPTTQDFKEVGTGNKPISQVVADNTGTALDSRIEAVVLPTGIATPVVSGDADLGSNSPQAILGTNGDDILTGDSGNNVLMGMRGNDSLDGGIGNDSVFGGKGSDTILGSSGDDALLAGRGADILNGDDGNDILYGGKGDDLLNGGLGIDTLIGGMGVDKFLLSTNSGTDTITDFEVGKDLLVLGNGLSFSQLAIAQDSGATLIRFAQTGEILASLGGVSASSISAANFGLI